MGKGLSLCLKAPPIHLMASAPSTERHVHQDGLVDTVDSTVSRRITRALCWGAQSHAQSIFSDLVSDNWGQERPDCCSAPAKGDKPGVVVLSGFLGAGKTSFLNQFIEFHTSRGLFVTVIQNEIGEIGVDGKLLEGDESIVEIDAGCVCCTLAGSLSSGVRRLMERFRPEIIVLETTGLANPINVVRELRELSHLVRLEAVVTLVDAARIRENLRVSDVARDQVAAADMIVLNKCDLTSSEEQDLARQVVRELNPRAGMLTTDHGRVNPGLVPQTSRHATGLLDYLIQEHHPHHHDHRHDGFGYVRLNLAREVDEALLRDLLDRCNGNVYRVKGIVNIRDAGTMALQYVPGTSELTPLEKDYHGAPFLIVIGSNLNAGNLAAHWRPVTREEQ